MRQDTDRLVALSPATFQLLTIDGTGLAVPVWFLTKQLTEWTFNSRICTKITFDHTIRFLVTLTVRWTGVSTVVIFANGITLCYADWVITFIRALQTSTDKKYQQCEEKRPHSLYQPCPPEQ
jgi:hypothetical protein